MNRIQVAAAIFALSLGAASSGWAAQPAPSLAAPLLQRYPAGSIATREQADGALEEAKATRTALQEEFKKSSEACYERFFATACIDVAKERRRAGLSAVRKVEVEANAWVRRERAEDRDRATAERMRKSARERSLVTLPAQSDEAQGNQVAPAVPDGAGSERP